MRFRCESLISLGIEIFVSKKTNYFQDGRVTRAESLQDFNFMVKQILNNRISFTSYIIFPSTKQHEIKPVLGTITQYLKFLGV